MIRGYARVSTDRQDLTMQLQALEAAGVEKVYRDKITGTTKERPALRRLLREVEDGDQVVVFKIDRMARSTRDALNVIHELTERGVAFRSIHEAMIDTTAITADGDVLNAAMKTSMLQMMAVFAELERAFIVGRTQEGLRIAKANGVKLGAAPQAQRRATSQQPASSSTAALTRSPRSRACSASTAPPSGATSRPRRSRETPAAHPRRAAARPARRGRPAMAPGARREPQGTPAGPRASPDPPVGGPTIAALCACASARVTESRRGWPAVHRGCGLSSTDGGLSSAGLGSSWEVLRSGCREKRATPAPPTS